MGVLFFCFLGSKILNTCLNNLSSNRLLGTGNYPNCVLSIFKCFASFCVVFRIRTNKHHPFIIRSLPKLSWNSYHYSNAQTHINIKFMKFFKLYYFNLFQSECEAFIVIMINNKGPIKEHIFMLRLTHSFLGPEDN